MTVPKRDPLTVDQARDAVARLCSAEGTAGPRPDGTAHCPACGPPAGGHTELWTLAITQNGNGAHLACTNGCPPVAIDVALRQALRTIEPPPSSAGPLEQVRHELASFDPVRRRLDGLHRIVRYGDGEVLELHFADRPALTLGSAEQLSRTDHFRKRIASIGVVAPRLKSTDYDELLRNIFDAAEDRQGAGTEADETDEWIAGYLRGTVDVTIDVTTGDGKRDLIRALDNGPATDLQGRTYLRPDNVTRWLRRAADITNINSRDLQTRLARLGWTPDQISARDPRSNKVHKVRAWASPAAARPHIHEHETPVSTRGDSGDNGDTHIQRGKPGATPGDKTGTTGDKPAKGTT